jgi:hypothetical protein
MTSLIKRMAYDAAEPFERLGAELFRKSAPVFIAASCLAVSLVFLTAALNDFLRAVAGPEIAALSVGGVYLALALILFLTAGTEMGGAPESGTPVSLPVKAAAEKTVAMQSNDFSRLIDGIVAPIHDALREAGLERERATLVAGAAIAKELTPLAGVAVAFVTGLIVRGTLGGRQRRTF